MLYTFAWMSTISPEQLRHYDVSSQADAPRVALSDQGFAQALQHGYLLFYIHTIQTQSFRIL